MENRRGLLDELQKIGPHFNEVRLVEVEHVTRIIINEVDALAAFGREAYHLIEGVLDATRWGGEVGVTSHDENAEVRVIG